MTLAILYVVTFAVFLTIDYIGLSYIVKPTFEKDIAPLLLDSPRIGPAFAFYAFYVGCLLWFVSWPALQDDRSLLWVFGSAALIGAMAYGTYEFTNLATLKDWTRRMVATDLTWGTVLTGTSATAGVFVARWAGKAVT
ncbi:hypothetical protein ROLI_008870 [Roseobacter fucihabitans]|uniref:DUF2177 domain-containing protein n=1 Tax=Roseobacter fucihabitans TaxID=1537242 RepID=A0ABZ2BRH2_9RHOB|nr:DUF2177 family protein [Roseobacter litoralis]MBC6968345.1 hypothetical protein [Roseobacter litoralis]